MYVAAVWIIYALNNYLEAVVSHVSSVFIRALFPMIFPMNIIWVPSKVLVIASNMAYNYDPNKRTTCITTW